MLRRFTREVAGRRCNSYMPTGSTQWPWRLRIGSSFHVADDKSRCRSRRLVSLVITRLGTETRPFPCPELAGFSSFPLRVNEPACRPERRLLPPCGPAWLVRQPVTPVTRHTRSRAALKSGSTGSSAAPVAADPAQGLL